MELSRAQCRYCTVSAVAAVHLGKKQFLIYSDKNRPDHLRSPATVIMVLNLIQCVFFLYGNNPVTGNNSGIQCGNSHVTYGFSFRVSFYHSPIIITFLSQYHKSGVYYQFQFRTGLLEIIMAVFHNWVFNLFPTSFSSFLSSFSLFHL